MSKIRTLFALQINCTTRNPHLASGKPQLEIGFERNSGKARSASSNYSFCTLSPQWFHRRASAPKTSWHLPREPGNQRVRFKQNVQEARAMVCGIPSELPGMCPTLCMHGSDLGRCAPLDGCSLADLVQKIISGCSQKWEPHLWHVVSAPCASL